MGSEISAEQIPCDSLLVATNVPSKNPIGFYQGQNVPLMHAIMVCLNDAV